MSYVSKHKSQLLDSVENQVLYADLACLLVADKGVGKSFFLEQLLQRTKSEVFTAQIFSEPGMSSEQLEKAVCLQLGLSWQDSEATLIEKLAEQLDRRALLLVDDAHLLPAECLNFLMQIVLNQVTQGKTNVFIVMSGQKNLVGRLNETPALQINDQIAVVFELSPIEVNEVKFLISDFQSIDPATVEALYDQQRLENFWALSEGVPGRIKYHLERWLEQTEGQKPKRESPRATGRHASQFKKYLMAGGYGVIAAGLILMLVFQQEINQVINPEKVIPTSIEEANNSPLGAANEVRREKMVKADSAADAKPLSQAGSTETDPKIEVEKDKPSQQAALKQTSESSGEQTVLPDDTDEIKVDTEKVQAEEPAVEAAKESVAKKAPVVKRELPQSGGSEKATESGVLITAEDPQLTDEKQLMSLRANMYSLQWVGLSSLEAARDYRSKHPLQSQMSIYKRVNQGGSLFLVVSGQFNSRIDADNARKIYAKRGYPGSPWVKSVAAIQKEIQESS